MLRGKKNAIEAALSLARKEPRRHVVLYQDEVTFYRQPSQGWLWAYFGRRQPKMPYSHRANTRMRIVGYLNATSGAVHGEDMSTVSARRLARSVGELSQWYPRAEKIYLVWDNWPVHRHRLVEKALAAQTRVEVLWLPTYAPWLNPIEKLWRWMRQRLIHAHPWCDDFVVYRDHVREELARLSEGSEELLTYTGLSC